MPRLRRSDPHRPGLTRRRAGRGWVVLDPTGQRVTDPDVLARVRSLVIPPAWRDVWICPDPNGHIQAVGTDAAGRRQYRYHDVWREHRDRAKHDRVLVVGEKLPAMRRRWKRDLARPELDRDRVLAAVARLLDLGLFRVGGEEYAEENSTYGLATLRREHVGVSRGRLVFDYTAKGGLRRLDVVDDPQVRPVIEALRRRRGDPSQELFAYRTRGAGGAWCDVKSSTVNDYLREVSGLDMSAKDFRTWHATVLMAAILARQPPPASAAGRKRAVRAGYAEVAEALGNTPAVCKASYVDPRVVDLFDDGTTITLPPARRTDEATRSALERETLDLLRAGPD
ncbi:MAG TPA: DNA topoisomerase IB [Mycobacteriales bacterium]|nr:DNA topoisomerase IB [Mycobacteriales bacterium]